MENPCKVFPGTPSYRSLCRRLNVGVEKYIHTRLNETEQKSWKTPWQPEKQRPREEKLLEKVTQQESDRDRGQQ